MEAAVKRALVVIDVQNEYVTGGLRIEHPPVAESLRLIGVAMDAAHVQGVPVIVVQQTSAATAPLFANGSAGWQLHAVVAERPMDHLVQKTLPGALAETDIAAWVAERGITTLTLCGYMTHNCVMSTAVEAVHKGLAVEYLHDASGTVSYANAQGNASAEELHRVFGVVMHSRFAAVAATDDWIAAITRNTALPRSTIYASHVAAVEALA